MDRHDEIAAEVAEIFISLAYEHHYVTHATITGGHDVTVVPPKGVPGIDAALMTPDSLNRALTVALATFARKYGLTPATYWEKPDVAIQQG